MPCVAGALPETPLGIGQPHAQEGNKLSNRQKAKFKAAHFAARAATEAANEELFRQRGCHIYPMPATADGSAPKGTSHVERSAPRGYASEEWFACVHTPLSIPKALKIPAAREALEKEWKKLETKVAWDVSKVQPKAKVIRDAKARGVPAHFGSLMDLCHIKNSQIRR